MSDIVVGLDIGTCFIRTVIGELTDNDRIQIISARKIPSPGLINGTIVNIESVMQSIKEIIEEDETETGYEVRSCVTGIGGGQIESWDSRGVVVVAGKGNTNREITETDMERVIDVAKGFSIPPDRQILHVIPRYYIVDGQGGIKNPKDMLGVRLEAETHLVTASSTSINNIQKCIRRAGYTVDEIMLKTLAATYAVMTDDELELGSILIDLGGENTDAIVFLGGAPICTVSIPVGSTYVTNDIVCVKGISYETAESTKLKYGCCWEDLILDDTEEVIIPGIGGRGPEVLSRRELCQIIQARIEEMFNMIKVEIVRKTHLTQLSGNVVLTGGGAQLLGITELAQKVFRTTAVRVGVPGNRGDIPTEYRLPEYATAIGLVLSNTRLKNRIDTKRHNKYNSGETKRVKSEQASGIMEKMRAFFNELF